MRFPLRLTADLTVGLAGQALRGRTRRPLMFRFSPMGEASRPPLNSEKSPNRQKSVTEVPASVQDSTAPVVWMAGAEPLLHPEAPRLTRALIERGRHVFLQTDGNLLRRRIHEFQPVPRFSFVVDFNGMPDSHDLRAGRPGAFHSSAEGIRVAKLSGFLTCAYTAIAADTTIDELQRLSKYLQGLKMDGWVIVPASGASSRSMCKRETARQNLAEARRLIPSRRWQFFSELVEAVAAPSNLVEPPLREFAGVPRPDASGVCDESVQVQ
jgi:MoaA/NifB/PqqE/SkfB family radical SAM enzyme